MKKIAEIWNKLKLWQQILIIVAVIGIAFSTFLFSTKPSEYTLLFSELDSKEAVQIGNELATMGVDYELQDKNATIMVKTPDVATIRMQLAAKGLPSTSGPGFELFDGTKLGASNFENKVNYTRAVVGNVQKTLVQGIDGIQSAVVSMPLIEDKKFFEQDDTPLEAKVIVKEKSGTKLTEEQVRGIQNFVAGAAKNMKPENVTVIDGTGVVISDNDTSDSGNSSASYSKQQKIEAEMEDRIKKDIMSTVGTVLGPENIKLTIRADIKFDEIVQNIEKYDPQGTLVSSQKNTEKTSDTASGVTEAGTESSGDVADYELQNNNGNTLSSSEKESIIENFEVGKTVETVRKNPELQTLNVSVYVNEKKISKAKLADLEQNVATSAGLIDKDGDGKYDNGEIVVNEYEFNNNNQETITSTDNVEKPSFVEENKWLILALGGLIIVIIILIIAFVLLSSKKKKEEKETTQQHPLETMNYQKTGVYREEDEEVEINIPKKKEDKIKEKFISETVKLVREDKNKAIEYFRKSLNER